jgi:hypothetical protein
MGMEAELTGSADSGSSESTILEQFNLWLDSSLPCFELVESSRNNGAIGLNPRGTSAPILGEDLYRWGKVTIPEPEDASAFIDGVTLVEEQGAGAPWSTTTRIHRGVIETLCGKESLELLEKVKVMTTTAFAMTGGLVSSGKPISLLHLVEEKAPAAIAMDSCGKCGNKDAKMQCSACRFAFYCDADHQRAAWSSHKAQCKRRKEGGLRLIVGGAPTTPNGPVDSGYCLDWKCQLSVEKGDKLVAKIYTSVMRRHQLHDIALAVGMKYPFPIGYTSADWTSPAYRKGLHLCLTISEPAEFKAFFELLRKNQSLFISGKNVASIMLQMYEEDKVGIDSVKGAFEMARRAEG